MNQCADIQLLKRYKDGGIMRITCINKDTDNSFDLKSVNLLSGPNNVGKTLVMDYLYNGYQGKLKKKFIVDGNEVSKDEYYTFLITETDSLDNEKLLGSKSIVKQNVSETFGSLEQTSIELLSEQITRLQELIEREVLSNLTLSSGLSINVSLNVEDVISKFSSVIYNEIGLSLLSYSTKRLAYFKMYINLLLQLNQKSILLIDGFDNGLSKYEAKQFLSYLDEAACGQPLTIILSSVNYYDGISNLYCGENKITNHLLLREAAVDKLAVILSEDAKDFWELYDQKEIDELLNKHQIYINAISCYMSNKQIHTDYVNVLNV